MSPGKRLAILGAGPMGLFAAFLAARRGYEVTVLEQGRIGESLLSWGSVRLFSPLSMNLPAGLRDALPGLPPEDALLTGRGFVDQVLLPLSRHPLLYDRVSLRHRVLGLSRAGLSRRDLPGHPVRHEKPFRLAVEGPDGEYLLEADRVFDATGSYAVPAWAGEGGLPAPGERAAGARVIRRLGALEEALAGLAGGRVLLLGHGHSAAHALLALEAAASRAGGGTAGSNSKVTVTWMFRARNLRPLRETPSDPLPERDRVVKAANALASAPPPWLTVRRHATLASLAPAGSRLLAHASPGASAPGPTLAISAPGGRAGSAPESLGEFDLVAAFTGSAPDESLLAGLAVDLSPATGGTRRLQAVLAGATDCLSVPKVSAADLASGEPGLHLIGARSYGRSSAFLLRDGIAHVEALLDHDA